jgi:hypothetical protein
VQGHLVRGLPPRQGKLPVCPRGRSPCSLTSRLAPLAD